jgi:hypothetical protein
MTKKEIIKKVKALKLTKNSYVIFGSCPMAASGIREASDIDLLVSECLFDELKRAGWKELEKSYNDKPLTHDVFEAHDNWNFSSYRPTLKQLLASANRFEGVPFASLIEVKKWKTASGRPKDIVDIKLIDEYFSKQAHLK